MQAKITASLFKNIMASQVLLIIAVFMVADSNALRLTKMQVPAVADLRENMTLDCYFDMGTEDLYAVKWYKDDQEFFRYMPAGPQRYITFPVPGVYSKPSDAECRIGRCKIVLTNLSRIHTTGSYRCEISSEAPAFRLASETHNISVAAIPKANPKIDGLVKSYAEGDNFSVKCTSDYADPEPILAWKINGNDPPAHAISHISSSEPDQNGLISRTISLRLVVDKKMPHGNDVEVSCESAQPGIPEAKKITSYKIAIRKDGEPQVLKNQKWYSISSSFKSNPNFHIAWLFICVIVIKWTILGNM
ncbi:uncharacterized protein LOC130445382 [Diorhabda sublineata]|uniref:uncharacterized protein LOC130445382 n=1 Tax=Diorhabda sublineata TaxID=1163346 RepID=UPI0024E07FD7|nr:uncharacterized protein LOC130445382 [Diorhabda sublineata]